MIFRHFFRHSRPNPTNEPHWNISFSYNLVFSLHPVSGWTPPALPLQMFWFLLWLINIFAYIQASHLLTFFMHLWVYFLTLPTKKRVFNIFYKKYKFSQYLSQSQPHLLIRFEKIINTLSFASKYLDLCNLKNYHLRRNKFNFTYSIQNLWITPTCCWYFERPFGKIEKNVWMNQIKWTDQRMNPMNCWQSA